MVRFSSHARHNGSAPGIDQPIAGAVLAVGAVANPRGRPGERHVAAVSIRPERRHHRQRRQEAKRMAAALALRVLEIDELPAILAFEKLHRCVSRAYAVFRPTQANKDRSRRPGGNVGTGHSARALPVVNLISPVLGSTRPGRGPFL